MARYFTRFENPDTGAAATAICVRGKFEVEDAAGDVHGPFDTWTGAAEVVADLINAENLSTDFPTRVKQPGWASRCVRSGRRFESDGGR